MHISKVPLWEVDISVIGPVTIDRKIELNARKDLNGQNPFYSKVSIQNTTNGFNSTLTSFASDNKLAEKASMIFLGRMLDALSLEINLSLQLDISKNIFVPKGTDSVRRVINKEDFINAFKEARLLILSEPTFLRSLSWFRKGKYTQDPFDRFLAFWNSIETVVNKHNPNRNNCENKGTICHTWECFKHLWGECKDWKHIGGQTEWIDSCNDIRTGIAHGIIPIEIHSVEKVIEKLEVLENVAYKFLKDWRREKLSPTFPEEIEGEIS